MNRADRRRLRAVADDLAERAARTMLAYDAAGQRRPLDDPRALALVRRGLAHVLRHGAPFVARVSADDASRFPLVQPAPPSADWHLAVGIDRAGVATYCLRPLHLPEASPAARRRLAEMLMAAELGRELARPGFPSPAVAEP